MSFQFSLLYKRSFSTVLGLAGTTTVPAMVITAAPMTSSKRCGLVWEFFSSDQRCQEDRVFHRVRKTLRLQTIDSVRNTLKN